MTKYLNELFRLKCSSDLIKLGLFPNAKEWTESCGVYHAARNFLEIPFKNPNIGLVSVGDGVSPRTGALFAFRSAWTCYSIDPNMRMDKKYDIDRLFCLANRIEEVQLDLSKFEQTVIVMVHSHATVENTLKTIKADKLHLICLPCCVPQELPNIPFIGYRDSNVLSPKNEIKVWKDLHLSLPLRI